MYQKQSKETIKIKKLIVVFFACIFLISTLSICAFAATVTVSEETSISMDDILNSEVVSTLKVVVVTLVNPIAAASMSMALFGLAFSSGQKQTENILKTVKAITIAFVILNGLGLLLSTIGAVVGTHAYVFS